jgi:hypothetical protein
MKDEKAIDRREEFSQFPLDKENKLNEGSWKTWARRVFCILCFFWKEKKNECVRGKLVVMCEEVLYMEKNVCKKKTWKEVVCSK